MPSSRNLARPQATRAAVLALIAGYVDAYAFLTYGVYASFMSGNTTQTGLRLGQANLTQAGMRLSLILGFMVGAFAGTSLMHSGRHPTGARLFGPVAALLAVGALSAYLGGPAHWLGVILLSLAMGGMETAVAKVGEQSVGVGFMTGALNSLAQHVALALKRVPLPQAQGSWDTHARRAALLSGLWGAFLIGALVGAAATSRFGAWTLLPPTLTLLALAVVEARSARSCSRCRSRTEACGTSGRRGSRRSLRRRMRPGSVRSRR
jgi:uncharacterized membrane protein YoaK (UPF0700 family)